MSSLTPEQQEMIAIWEKIPKNENNQIHYQKSDIPYLYNHGFVNSELFTLDQWLKALNPFQQKDGSYLVDQQGFLGLAHFRLRTNVSQKPFDPNRICEGEWTKKDLQKLFDISVKPSSTLEEKTFWKLVDALIKQGFEKNGHFLLTSKFKDHLAHLIEQQPSPRRKLEFEVQRIHQQKEGNYRRVQENPGSSSFTQGKLASESQADEFRNLTGSRPIQNNQQQSTAEPEGIDIKNFKKPPRQFRG